MLRLQSVSSPSSSSASPPTPPTPGGDRSPKSKMSMDTASPNLVLRVKRKRGQHYVVNAQGQQQLVAPGSSSALSPGSNNVPNTAMTASKTSPSSSRQNDAGSSASGSITSSASNPSFSKGTSTPSGAASSSSSGASRGTTISAGGGGAREAHRMSTGGSAKNASSLSSSSKSLPNASTAGSSGLKNKSHFSSSLSSVANSSSGTPSATSVSHSSLTSGKLSTDSKPASSAVLTPSTPTSLGHAVSSSSAAASTTTTTTTSTMVSTPSSTSTATTSASNATNLAVTTAGATSSTTTPTTSASADGTTTPAQPAKHPLLALIHAAHPRPFPQALPKPKPAEPSKQDVGIDTSESGVGTMTEPEFLGPCEPGTSVNLDGIVWHETDGGLLVVNVTWRGKTYVGTLLDASKNDWAAPRFSEPTKPARGRGRKGRLPTSEGRVGGAGRGKGRKGSKAATATAAEAETPSPAKSESRGSDAENDDASIAKRFRLNSGESSEAAAAPGGQYFECTEPDCCKKFRNINGLKYHQSSSHPPEGVDPSHFEDADEGGSSSRHRGDRDHRHHHHHRDRDRDHHRHHGKDSRGSTPGRDSNKGHNRNSTSSSTTTPATAASLTSSATTSTTAVTPSSTTTTTTVPSSVVPSSVAQTIPTTAAVATSAHPTGNAPPTLPPHLVPLSHSTPMMTATTTSSSMAPFPSPKTATVPGQQLPPGAIPPPPMGAMATGPMNVFPPVGGGNQPMTTIATPVVGSKHPLASSPSGATVGISSAEGPEKHNKKQKLDKPGTQVKVRGTALIPPMKPIVPALQPRGPPGAVPGGGNNAPNSYQPVTTPAGASQQGSPPNAASLKPIQPKPTILGEPSPINPHLVDLKEKKKKKKMMKEGEMMQGQQQPHMKGSPKLSPPHTGVRTGKTPPPSTPPSSIAGGALSPSSAGMHGYPPDHPLAAAARAQGSRTPTGGGPHTPGTPQPPNLDVMMMPGTLDKNNVALHNAANNSAPPPLLPGKEDDPPRLNSPAYSDISDPSDPAPVLENENAKKEDVEGPGSERTYMPPFSPYYGQPPYLVPMVTTASTAPSTPGANLVTVAGAPANAPPQGMPPSSMDPRLHPGAPINHKDGRAEPGAPAVKPGEPGAPSDAPGGVPPPIGPNSAHPGGPGGASAPPQGVTQAQAAALYATNPYYYAAYYDAYCRHMTQVDPQYRAQYEKHMAEVQRQQEQQQRKDGGSTPNNAPGKPAPPKSENGPPPHDQKIRGEDEGKKGTSLDQNYQKRQSENHQILKENMEMKMQMTATSAAEGPPSQPPAQQRPREFPSYDPRDPRAMYQQTQEETRRYMDMVKKQSTPGGASGPPPPMGPAPSPLQRPPSRGSDRGAPTSAHHPSPGGGGPRGGNPLPPHFHHGVDKRSSSPNHPGNVPRSPYPPGGLQPQQHSSNSKQPQSQPPSSMSTPTKPRPSSPLASPRDMPQGGNRQHHSSSSSASSKDHSRERGSKDDASSVSKGNPNEPKDLSSSLPRERLPPGAASTGHQRPPSSSPLPMTSSAGQQPPPPHVAGYPPGYPIPYAAYAGMPIEAFYQRGIPPYAGAAAAAASPYARPPFLPPGTPASQYPPGIPPGLASPVGQPGGPNPQRHPGPMPPRHPLDGGGAGGKQPGAPSPSGHPLGGSNTAIEMLKQQAENARQNHKIHELGQVGAAGSPAGAPPPGHPPTSRPFDGLPPTSMMRGSPSGLPPGHPAYSLPPGYPAIIP